MFCQDYDNTVDNQNPTLEFGTTQEIVNTMLYTINEMRRNATEFLYHNWENINNFTVKEVRKFGK